MDDSTTIIVIVICSVGGLALIAALIYFIPKKMGESTYFALEESEEKKLVEERQPLRFGITRTWSTHKSGGSNGHSSRSLLKKDRINRSSYGAVGYGKVLSGRSDGGSYRNGRNQRRISNIHNPDKSRRKILQHLQSLEFGHGHDGLLHHEEPPPRRFAPKRTKSTSHVVKQSARRPHTGSKQQRRSESKSSRGTGYASNKHKYPQKHQSTDEKWDVYW